MKLFAIVFAAVLAAGFVLFFIHEKSEELKVQRAQHIESATREIDNAAKYARLIADKSSRMQSMDTTTETIWPSSFQFTFDNVKFLKKEGGAALALKAEMAFDEMLVDVAKVTSVVRERFPEKKAWADTVDAAIADLKKRSE